MTDKVIDTSALAAIAFQEREERAMRERLTGHQLHAPALLRFEMANVCLKKMRADRNNRDAIAVQHAQSLALPIREYDVDHADVLKLAEASGLSAYDASYLWLAQKLGAELVTLDERLKKAAAKL